VSQFQLHEVVRLGEKHYKLMWREFEQGKHPVWFAFPCDADGTLEHDGKLRVLVEKDIQEPEAPE